MADAFNDHTTSSASQIESSISLNGMHFAILDRTHTYCICGVNQPRPVSNSQSQPFSCRCKQLEDAANALLLLSKPFVPRSADASAAQQASVRLPSFQSMFPTPPTTLSPVSDTSDERQPEGSLAQAVIENRADVHTAQGQRPVQKRRRKPAMTWERGSDQSTVQQFLCNIVLWFEELTAGVNPEHCHEILEQVARGLKISPQDGDALSPEETNYLKARKSDNAEGRVRYRSVRAKMMIGLACVYEHNIRGSVLKQRCLHHAAFGAGGKGFTYINVGKSQAQQLCKGVDVNSASKIFSLCQQDGRLPHVGTLVPGREPYTQTIEADALFPSDVRKRLYDELCGCYRAQHNLSPQSMLVITEEDLQQQRQPQGQTPP